MNFLMVVGWQQMMIWDHSFPHTLKPIKNSLKLPLMSDVDIIIELIGGSEGIAKKLVFSALKNGKHVIRHTHHISSNNYL